MLHAANVSDRQAYCTATATFAFPSQDFSRSVCSSTLIKTVYSISIGSRGRSNSELKGSRASSIHGDDKSNVQGGFKKELLYQGIQGDTLRTRSRDMSMIWLARLFIRI